MNDAKRIERRILADARLFILIFLSPLFTAPAGAQILPPGWAVSDVGSPIIPGFATSAADTFTVSGAGRGVTGTADQFTLAYRRLTGDGTIVARVGALPLTATTAHAGVMIRQGLSAGSAHASVLVSRSDGITFRRRATSGAATSSNAAAGGLSAVWVRVDRRSSTVTASYSTNGSTWTLLGTDTVAMNNALYVGLAVSSRLDVAALPVTFTGVQVTPLVEYGGPLPSGWSSQDIGGPGQAGAAAHDAGTFGLVGGGSDIGGTWDLFRFAYGQVTGDVDIVARVRDLGNTNAQSKAGIMVRDSLTANGAHASMFVTAAGSTLFRRRASGGQATVDTAGLPDQAPVWLKLSLRNGVASGYQSIDGLSWTLVGTQALTLPSAYYVGLAVTSRDDTATVTTNIDNVQVTAVANADPTVSLTAPANGSTYASPATIVISASASDPDGSIARVDFYQGTTLVGSDPTSPYSVTWSNVPAGTYSLTARAVDDDGATTASPARTVTVAAALPPGWTAADIGNATPAGRTTYSAGTFTVTGGGSDIWDPADEFHFVHQAMSGDIDVVARVATLGQTDSWSKAGVMIRASLAGNAAHVSMLASAAHGMAFQRRPTTGGASAYSPGSSDAAPVWVKLSRRGTTITAYESADGTAWTAVGTQTLSLPSTFYVGLAVSSLNTAATVDATFDNVAVQAPAANQAPSTALTAPANGASYTAPATITITATASDTDGTVARLDFYQGATLLASDTTSPYGFTWSNVPAGTYTLTARAIDDDGATTTSAARTVTVNSAPTQRSAVFNASPDHDALVSSYLLEIFAAGADPSTATPIATQNLGKPAVVNGECTADVTATINALAAGNYRATVAAVGSGGSSRSAPADFTR